MFRERFVKFKRYHWIKSITLTDLFGLLGKVPTDIIIELE